MILLGMPCTEHIKSRTAFSLFNLKGETTLSMQLGADVAHNRNKLVMQALEKNCSHILFIDSDMVFEPDTLTWMLARDKDILGLAANRRRLPLESVVKPLNIHNINRPLPTDLFEAASCGTGIMLIKTDIFRKLPAPWFEFAYVNGERIGEDVHFCTKAREAGLSVWVDPTIPVQHCGEYLY